MSNMSPSPLRIAPARWGRAGSLGLVAILASVGVLADPVPLGLSIQAKVAVDVANTQTATGGGLQQTTNRLTSGGVASAQSSNGSAAALVQGALTQTGDGLGAHATVSTGTANQSTSGRLLVDYTLNLSNTSAFTYTAVFHGIWSNNVSATGADAFAFSQWSLYDSAFNELMATEHNADSVNAGNNLIFDSATDTLTVVLAAGQSLAYSALLDISGGSFAAPGGYSGVLDAFLELTSVSGGNVDNNVPLPGSLALAGLGLVLLQRQSRQASRGVA